MRAKGWTCQRVSKGAACKQHNPPRTRKCGKCGKPRPIKRKPAHMIALELDYAGYILLNGGNFCAICGRKPQSKRLDRDHDHSSHQPRGLLCHRCNRHLPNWITAKWLRNAADYLDRANGL